MKKLFHRYKGICVRNIVVGFRWLCSSIGDTNHSKNDDYSDDDIEEVMNDHSDSCYYSSDDCTMNNGVLFGSTEYYQNYRYVKIKIPR